ncbi:MAG: Ldh family oxidoreductase [Granulosicoccus sp.]|nr:Ldh family oxidoreductase [Granulosicoccus sp.]
MAVTKTRLLTLREVEQVASSALLDCGFSAAQAESIAQTVTAAERDHCRSHGLFRIPFYSAALKNPSADAQAVPTLELGQTSVVHVDSKNGFCPLALKTGLPALLDKAREHGTAALAIHNTYNIAALWPEVEQLAEQGLVAFAFTAANAFVAPAGGTRPLFGTNPMAFAFPRLNGPPLVFDQASSATARGEIQLYLREGKSIPEGWAIDENGHATTDPEQALKGAQLPFGGYKGSSLALMVELLAAALIGEKFSIESSAHDVHKVGAPFGGELLLALDPKHFGSTDYLQRAEFLIEQLEQQPGTRLPSARRHQARAQSIAEGVEIPVSILEDIEALRSQ